MILLPIGRDKAVIQRHAWVTYGILAFYFASFVILALLHAGEERGFVEDVRAIVGHCFVLFAPGPYVEDVFGRPAFAMLYFGGAFAAAVFYGNYAKDATAGMFGASGAVSAVAGAFLVRFFNAKLEFFFVPFI